MTDATRKTQCATLTEEDIINFKQLSDLAGLHIREDSLRVLLELLALGASPSSLNTVLTAICKPIGSSTISKRQSTIATTSE
jgi:hypothetical protein